MAHMDPAAARAAQGLPGGAQDDRDMGDRERSGAIVEGGLVTKKWVRDPIERAPLFCPLRGLAIVQSAVR